MKTPEGKVKDKVDAYLAAIGAWYHRPFMAGYGKSGTPDFVCSIGGRFLGIEVKREGKTPTPLQELRMQEIRRSGGLAIWGDNADKIIEEIKTAFGFHD
jgi:hypothetical protein